MASIEEKLKSKEFINKVQILTEYLIDGDRFREAYDISKHLDHAIETIKGFKDKYYELYYQYQEIIIKLKWVGLPVMVEDKVVDFFRNHFVKIFKIPEYDVWNKLKTILLAISVFEKRDELKKQIMRALHDNNEKITSKNIIINNKEKSPTVSNWLNDYNSTLGTGRINKLARTQYLVNGQNIKGLNRMEKNKVKVLFDLYEKLKLSSLTFEGVEEDIPVDEDNLQGTIKGGFFEPFEQTNEQKTIWYVARGDRGGRMIRDSVEGGEKISLDRLENIANQYPDGSLERRAIEEEIDKQKELGGLHKMAREKDINPLEREAIDEEIDKLEES